MKFEFKVQSFVWDCQTLHVSHQKKATHFLKGMIISDFTDKLSKSLPFE